MLPAACGTAYYLIATQTDNRATHFVAPTTQSAVTNPQIADAASISLEEFERLVAAQAAIVIDARHPDEYAEGHVFGARNFHVEAVEADVSIITLQIDLMADIVLYCAGSTCEDSGRLYDILTKLLEYPNVRLFRGGMEAWQKAGLPIEKGRSP
jgi:rhodanese-related sulfurtransferase